MIYLVELFVVMTDGLKIVRIHPRMCPAYMDTSA